MMVCAVCAVVGVLLVGTGVVLTLAGSDEGDFLAMSLLPFAVAALSGAGASRLGERREAG